jgi:hypothetical protein
MLRESGVPRLYSTRVSSPPAPQSAEGGGGEATEANMTGPGRMGWASQPRESFRPMENATASPRASEGAQRRLSVKPVTFARSHGLRR